ncbi:MAG: helicase-related protein [Nitrospira sp.]|nr:helicase-related protein [Nitrospira sp.]
MKNEPPFQKGQLLQGPLFSETMRVLSVQPNDHRSWTLHLVGLESERYKEIILTDEDRQKVHALEPKSTYDGDGQLLRLGLQAHSLGIAYEFDPYFGLSLSRVDPLPHQLDAVYEHLLKLARVRFLLADDAGAGKTIMAGLLIRELQLRGLARRILVVCPSNLSFQWQRELREKFDEKFLVLKGSDMREQFGINQWLEKDKIITSLDLAKRGDIMPGLHQAHWDLVIVDEAHRMSARDAEHKSQRYRLGEALRDKSDHLLLLTATPHKGDPENFTLFLQLLDKDAFADVKSIEQAMHNQRAPFYLRRTKEAMVYFPTRGDDGQWTARKIFTQRFPKTVDFEIDGDERTLYENITRFVKNQSRRAAGRDDDRRARAVGFLMALYQRRLASSTRAVQRSLANRARRLTDGLHQARALTRQMPDELPSAEDMEEMDENEREHWERIAEAVTLTDNAEEVRGEIAELRKLAEQAARVEDSAAEAKLAQLKELLQVEQFADDAGKRLLIFTEFRDTLTYLMEKLQSWNFRVGCIHGGMRPGSRTEPGTRLHTEQLFRDGEIQVLVATEAAGEGINLQVCNILFNYDIPWNPNRLEQRMGRIHRYGQLKDCLIFNFVATNTVEGRVLQKLLDKLEEIRNALDDDAVFNVVGEVLPATHMEQILRRYYAGDLGEADMEDRLLRNVDAGHFRDICQTALEGLASRELKLDMIVERRARAIEHRIVPEDIARFILAAAKLVPFRLQPVGTPPTHTFIPGPIPSVLRQYERDPKWRFPPLADRYRRCSTDRKVAEEHHVEWVTPGHPLFESIRRHTLTEALVHFTRGACFYSVQHDRPARLDFYRARVVDGQGSVVHERMFVVELTGGDNPPCLREPGALGDFTPATLPADLPAVASADDASSWLYENALLAFLDDTKQERLSRIETISEHVEVALTELIQREDEKIGRAIDEKEQGVVGAEGRLAQAEHRHSELSTRREQRRLELQHQRSLVLQAPERLTSVLVLPHPGREDADIRKLRSNPETEATAMRVAMEHERAEGRQAEDVSANNFGYDLTGLDRRSGELRLIEVKGLAAVTGDILLTPNEHRIAEDRRDCYWLYVVTNCTGEPVLHTIPDPASKPWRQVRKVQHYTLPLSAVTRTLSGDKTPPKHDDTGTHQKAD